MPRSGFPSPTAGPTPAEIARSQAQRVAERAAARQRAAVRFEQESWRDSVRDARPYLGWNAGYADVYQPQLVYVDDGTPATLAPGQPEPRRTDAWRGWYSPEDDTHDHPPGLDPPRAVRWEDEKEVRARAMADYVVVQSACPHDGVRFVPAQPLPPNTYPQKWECARTEPCPTCSAHPGAVWHLTGETWMNDGASEPQSPSDNAVTSSAAPEWLAESAPSADVAQSAAAGRGAGTGSGWSESELPAWGVGWPLGS